MEGGEPPLGIPPEEGGMGIEGPPPGNGVMGAQARLKHSTHTATAVALRLRLKYWRLKGRLANKGYAPT